MSICTCERCQAAALREMILDAAELLDPDHSGVQWPDPIGWDGRPFSEQARDLLPLLDAAGTPQAATLRTDMAALAAKVAP